MLKAIIFDMDGVLINSVKYCWKAFNIALKDSGIRLSNEDIKKSMGIPLKDSLRLWKKDYKIKDYNPEEFSRKAGEIELELMKKDLHPNKALNNLLKEAKEKQIKMALATSSLRWRVDKILKLLEIKDMFDVILTAEDVETHKPSPEIFLRAAEQMNENHYDCVVFEDALSGIEAAIRGNMKVVAVKTEFFSEEELKDADMVINDFSEININKLKNMF